MIQIRPPQRPRKGGTLRPLGFFRSGPARQQSWLVTWDDAGGLPMAGTIAISHLPENPVLNIFHHPLTKFEPRVSLKNTSTIQTIPRKKKNLLAVCACFQVAMPVALAGKGTNSCCQGRSNQRTDSRPGKFSRKILDQDVYRMTIFAHKMCTGNGRLYCFEFSCLKKKPLHAFFSLDYKSLVICSVLCF